MDQKVPGGVQGIVLDLRYNGGGYVEMAKALIETLTQRGVILHERWRDDRAVSDLTTTILNTPSVKQEQFTAAQIDALADLKKLPLVVLINGSSASAAEIVAGSLQEARPNTLVLGERSFGKGVEMLVQTLPTCGQLAITARTYTLPSGKWLHHVGITPDMVVHQPRDSRDDAQLSAALNYLLAKTATNGANVVQMQPEDHTILGTTPDRPFEPKLNTWKLYIDAHRGDITRGAVGGFLFLILGFYCWLTRSKKKS
jgi:C-terminal peptidase prc